MINYKHKFIFVHIPKCGGSSVEIAFTGKQHVEWDADNNIWIQHATAKQIKEIYCPKYEQYFSFTFVRNPWDRAVSDYMWIRRALSIADEFKNFLLLKGKFDTPRLKYPHINKSGRGDHILPQSDFILDSNGDQMVDFVGSLENFQEDFNIICDKIGIPRQKLPHQNKSKHKHYTEYYDEETKQIVAEKYAKDIEYFGYDF